MLRSRVINRVSRIYHTRSRLSINHNDTYIHSIIQIITSNLQFSLINNQPPCPNNPNKPTKYVSVSGEGSG